MRTKPTLTESRHQALRHHLPGTEAEVPATDNWVLDRIALHAASAGVDPVEAFTDPAAYEAVTHRPVPANCWGQADWAGGRRLVYVDPAKCGNRATAELVAAHEVSHLRWPTTRHTTRFFQHVQALLDRSVDAPQHDADLAATSC